MISGFRAYQIFNSVKMHFTSKHFSIIKYGTRLARLNEQAYNKVQGKYWYEKLASKFPTENELTIFVAVGMATGRIKWIRDVFESYDDITSQVRERKRVLSAPDYQCKYEIQNYLETYTFDRDANKLCVAQTSGSLRLETIVLCERSFALLNLFKWEENNLIQTEFVYKVSKYQAFVPSLSDEQNASLRKCMRSVFEHCSLQNK